MDDITEEQKSVIDELRRRTINEVTAKMLEDVSLFYRFAKARDFDVVEAEAMLRNHISWRKEHQIDTILTDYEPPEVCVKYAPTSFVCFDKEGSVVRLNDAGRMDVKTLWNLLSKTEMAKYIVFIMEQDKERVIKQGRNLGKPLYTVIYDFENLSLANTVRVKNVQYSLHLLKMFVDNYPETIRRVIVINDGWKEDLLEFIDADELPACLGGNRTDTEIPIHRGQQIPKSCYTSKKGKQLSLDPDVERLTVMPLSKEEITFEVREENSYLEWEFKTKNKDIEFSLVLRENLFDPLVLIPQQRVDTSLEPERGFFKCKKVGNYSIVFDNSYSWFHSKEVYYKVGVKSPKNEDIYEAT